MPSVATPVISCLNPNLLLFGSTHFTDSLWYRPAITRLPPKEVKIGAKSPNRNRYILFQRTQIEKEESDESAQLIKTGSGKFTRQGWNRASARGGERESWELRGAMPKLFLPPQGGEKWLCIFTFLFMMLRFQLEVDLLDIRLISNNLAVMGITFLEPKAQIKNNTVCDQRRDYYLSFTAWCAAWWWSTALWSSTFPPWRRRRPTSSWVLSSTSFIHWQKNNYFKNKLSCTNHHDHRGQSGVQQLW